MPELRVQIGVWVSFDKNDLKKPVDGRLCYKVTLDEWGHPSDIHVSLSAAGTTVEMKLPGLAKRTQIERTDSFQAVAILMERELAASGAFGVMDDDDSPIYRRLKPQARKPRLEASPPRKTIQTATYQRPFPRISKSDWIQKLWEETKK